MVSTHAVTDIGSLQHVMLLQRGSRVVVTLPPLPVEESARLQDRMNRLISECGCSFSACALIAAVLACALFDAAHWSGIEAHILRSVAINLAACFSAVGLGKTAGLYRARRKLAHTVEAVAAQLISQQSA
jgi:hypothetical protein